TACRLAFLRSFTVEPMLPMLSASCVAAGVDLETYVGEFNAYVQDLINPESPLYKFAPTAAVLAVQTRDIAPELWNDFVFLQPEQVDQVVERVIASFKSWIEAFRARSKAHLIIHNLERPEEASSGVFDQLADRSQAE